MKGVGKRVTVVERGPSTGRIERGFREERRIFAGGLSD